MPQFRLKLTRSFIPVLLLLLGACGMNPVAAKEQITRYAHPYLAHPYDPKGEIVIAHYSGGDITDLDLYLYLLMTGYDRPEIFDLYYRSRRESARKKIGPALQEQIDNYIVTASLAQEGRLTERTPGVALLTQRYYELPVAAWVWMTRALQPLIALEEPDRIQYFNEHRNEFIRNEQVLTRMIYLKLESSDTLETENETRRILDLLRASALDGADFGGLARQYSESPSAVDGGLLPPMEKGKFDFAIEERIFSVEPGQLTPVFRGPGGYYLFKIEEKLPYKEFTLQEAQPKIDRALNKHVLKELFEFRFLQITRHQATLRDTNLIYNRPQDQTLLQVGRRKLNVAQFVELFPAIFVSPVELNVRDLNKTMTRAHDGEVIAQQIELIGLQDEPRLRSAHTLSLQLTKALNRYYDLRNAVSPAITADELDKFYQDNLEALSIQAQYRIFELSATPANITAMPPQELVRRRAEFNVVLSDLIDHLKPLAQDYVEQREASEQELGIAEPDPQLYALLNTADSPTSRLADQRYKMHVPVIMRDIAQYSTSDVTYRVEDLGFITPTSHKAIAKALGAKPRAGDFTRPRRKGASFSAYYIDRVIPGAPSDPEQYSWYIRSVLLAQRIEDALQERYDAILASAGAEYRFQDQKSAPEISEDFDIKPRDFLIRTLKDKIQNKAEAELDSKVEDEPATGDDTSNQ